MIDRVISESRTAFEEYGVAGAALEELRQVRVLFCYSGIVHHVRHAQLVFLTRPTSSRSFIADGEQNITAWLPARAGSLLTLRRAKRGDDRCGKPGLFALLRLFMPAGTVSTFASPR